MIRFTIAPAASGRARHPDRVRV